MSVITEIGAARGRGSRVAWMLVLLSLGLACQWSENRHLHRKVQAGELIGHWAATPFAMESLRYAGYTTHLDATEHRLSIAADGSCQAETVAVPSDSSPNGAGTWLSASMPCRWELQAEGEPQELDLVVSVPPGGERHLSFYFDEEDGGITLWQYAGDRSGSRRAHKEAHNAQQELLGKGGVIGKIVLVGGAAADTSRG